MSICKELDEAVQKYLRTATFPVAVKILDDASQFPERTRRPLRDLGHKLNLCQGVALARRYGWTIGFCEEDHRCTNSLILMGIKEVPEFIKNGSIVSPAYTDTLEHGALTQSITPGLNGLCRPSCWPPFTALPSIRMWCCSTAIPARRCAWYRRPSTTPAVPSSPSSWAAVPAPVRSL